MTALPLHPAPLSAPSAPSARSSAPSAFWFPLDEAARLLGITEGHCRRLCARDLAPRGLARKAGGGVWHVSAAASPRLVRAGRERTERGTSIVNDLLSGATSEQRAASEQRVAVLAEFRAWRSREGVLLARDLPSFLAAAEQRHGLRVSRRTLYRWDAACPATADRAGCVAALLDTRGRPPQGSPRCDDRAWEMFLGLYLTPRQWSVAKCWRAVRAAGEQEGWCWPSLRRVHELVRERIAPGTATLAREGHDAWRARHLAPMEQDPDAWAAGQCWEGDHSDLDFDVRVVRPDGSWARTRAKITAWLDRRSRRLMGWWISEQGSSGTIRTALLRALEREDASVPECVWIDNGKDFASAAIGGLTKSERRRMTRAEIDEVNARTTGVLGMLGIEPHFALPYNHNGKARVESFFRTMHEDFDREFASWCGSRPGQVDRDALRAARKDVLALPTIDDLRDRFAAWAEYYNARSEHTIDALIDRDTGERLSPLEFYERFLPARRALADRGALRLLHQVWQRPVAVHKWGVSLTLGGRSIRYGECDPALEPFVGSDRRVYLSYDPDDLNRVEVWDDRFRHLCTAGRNGVYGGLGRVSAADQREAWRRRAEQKRRAKRAVDVVAVSLSDAELAAVAARDREVAQTKARLAAQRGRVKPGDLPNLRIVPTPVDGQADRVESSRLRKAVGAEYEYGDCATAAALDLGSLSVVRHEEREIDLGAMDSPPDTEPESFGPDSFDPFEFEPDEDEPDVLAQIAEGVHD